MVKLSYSFISANMDTPSTEKRNRNRMSRAPTFIISGIAKMKVWKIYCRFLAAFISLRTLAILNDLIIVEIEPKSIWNT